MIHWFEIENLLSFADPVRIDLTPGKVVDDFSVFESPSSVRLNKFCAIVGPNASGKSNLLKSLAITSQFIVSSFKKDEDDETGFDPHFFFPNKQCRVAIEFETQPAKPEEKEQATGAVYRYEVSATTTHVIHEKLSIKTSKLFTRLYERLLDGDQYKFKGIAERFTLNMPKNASMISWLARQQVEHAMVVQNFFSNVSVPDSTLFGRMPPFFGAFKAIDIYRNTPKIKEDMVEIMRTWDLGIDGIEIVKRSYMDSEGKETTFWDAEVSHKTEIHSANLPLFEESSGTVELFGRIGPMYQTLAKGGVMLLDEIEDGLHPDLVEALLELFMQPETNPKNAQLLFTTHSHWIMDYLNKWQIILVEKRECASLAWKISTMKGIEHRDVLSKRYRSGALGAVPRQLSLD